MPMYEPVTNGERRTDGVEPRTAMRSSAAAAVAVAVANYPHIAGCSICADYLSDRVELGEVWTLVAGALNFHDSAHRRDTLTTASQHFGEAWFA
jgi:hypothetical protein